ncbi:hypothetical protein OHA71_06670 [Streptomyces sp. NBC_00444]|uniref:hypothetical protein n=1 Tax=Streptomyces sp. NBC_00444 TaxID=2975744 RepID=UPI002E1B12F2
MKPMTREQIDDVTSALGFATAADPDGVLRAVRALQYADRQRANPIAVRQALAAAQTVVKRLLAIETEHATTRAAIACLVVANNRGDDFSLSDLAFELEQAAVDLKDDYDTADALARAVEGEGLL